MCWLQQLLKCWVVSREYLSVYGLEFQGLWEAQIGKGSKRAAGYLGPLSAMTRWNLPNAISIPENSSPDPRWDQDEKHYAEMLSGQWAVVASEVLRAPSKPTSCVLRGPPPSPKTLLSADWCPVVSVCWTTPPKYQDSPHKVAWLKPAQSLNRRDICSLQWFLLCLRDLEWKIASTSYSVPSELHDTLLPHLHGWQKLVHKFSRASESPCSCL